MAEYPFALDQIVGWFRAKQSTIAGSDVQLVEIRERAEHLPGAAADFDAASAMGRINGWVSGEFDFEAVRISDGEDIFWRHVKTDSVEDLEDTYSEFIRSLRSCGRDHHSA